jgi:hypothetical protein
MSLISFDPIPGGALISSIAGLADGLIRRLFPDPADQDKAKLALLEMQQRGELATLAAEVQMAQGQMEINKVEAGSSSLFVAGWRPFIGWVCGSALAFQFIGAPALTWWFAAHDKIVKMPEFDFSALITIVFSLLGVGALRTVEKIKGVAR